MSERPRFQILIIGAGPAGLIAAAALAHEGHKVAVLERHQTLQAPGGTVVIQWAAVKALISIGAEEGLRQCSYRHTAWHFWSHNKYEPFTIAPASDHAPSSFTVRPDIQRMAYELCKQRGVEVLFGKNVARLDDDGKNPIVWTTEGERYTANLIIGADGIKSPIRRVLFPNTDVEPIATRETIYLSKVPVSTLAADQAAAPYLIENTVHSTFGPGRFTIGRVHHGFFHMLCIDVDAGDPLPVDSTWTRSGDPDALRARFADFRAPPFHVYLSHVTECTRWQIGTSAPVPSWRGGSGRVVLLGDAAHAMMPHMSQGLSQGIEDGVCLARMLRWARTDEDIARVTEAYEKLRRPRAELFVRMSTEKAAERSVPDGAEQEKRDTGIAARSKRGPVDWESVTANMDADEHSLEFQKWVSEYDVVDEVDQWQKKHNLEPNCFK